MQQISTYYNKKGNPVNGWHIKKNKAKILD